MLELSRTPEILNQTADSESQPSSNALVREAQLLWQGVSATPQYLQESFGADKRAHTAQTALISAGATLVLGCLKRSPSLAWTAGRVLVPALSIPLLSDLNSRVGNMSSAMADTWSSSRNWKQNVETSRENLGQFTADFAISAVASGVAEKATRSYFGPRTPGVQKLPELSKEGILSNWQKHMEGEIVPYRIYSPEGGGMRQVDLFIPQNIRLSGEASVAGKKGTGLLIAQDGLKLDFGKLKELELPDNGLVNLRADRSIDHVAAFTHPHRFRVVPGVNMSAWQHETGLIKEGGWFAPKTGHSDAAFITDVERTLTSMLKTERTVLAGYSSGAILSNEVASKLGPSRIHGVISVASTVTGRELAAVPGQFRLIVRDHGDPTLLQQGGAGGKAKVLASLGHRAVLQSMPENQISHALSPYQSQALVTRHHDFHPTASIQHIALSDGSPILAQIRTNNSKHAFMVKNAESLKAESAAVLPPHIQEHLDLNILIKDIVNGNLQRFRVPAS